MGSVLQRSIPTLLLVAGIASTIYGEWFHAQTVLEEREEEAEILIPLAGPAGWGNQLPGEDQGPDRISPDGSQSFMKKKITRKLMVEKTVAEPDLCREVSIGGVRLLESGELQQTYSGRPPSLCPT